MLKFKSLDHFYIKERGFVYVVSNPHMCDNFDHIVGKNVELNGRVVLVKGVEFHAHGSPWIADELIGILI